MALVDPGGGGNVVGIDPQLLGDLINSLKQHSGSAQGLVNSYLGQLSRCGLDTSRMTKAAQDLSWAQGQLPMLNRRQELAQAMEQQDPSLGPMVPGGAGYLDFPTDQAAQQAGQSDGAKALQALQDRSNTDFIQSELSQHGDDPAYLAAFFKSLGPHGLAQLGLQVNGYQQQGNKDQYQLWAGTVGTALATASYQTPFSNSWLSQITLPESSDIGPELDLIQPFLENGVYSSSWLNPLGQYALQQARIEALEPGMGPVPQLDGIWTAIGHNPSFDAQFYGQNFANKDPNADYPPTISYLMTNPMLQHSVVDGAFASMVQAATIPPDPSQFPGLSPAQFASNAQQTVQYFGSDPGLRTNDQVRAALGAIAMNYFGDMASSVRSAAPGMGSQNVPGWQVSATSAQWANFVTEAMRDKTTSATLLTFYAKWKTQQPVDWRGAGQEGVPDHQGFWNDFSLGVMDDFMASSYQLAGAPAGDSSNKIAEAAAAGGAAILTSLVFGPEAGVAELLLDGGKDAFQTTAESTLNEVFTSGVKPSSDPSQALQQLTGVSDTYSGIVQQWYGQGPPQIDPVQYLGHTYTGDPATYISQYGGPGKDANFISGGQIIDPAKMNSYQQAAYNVWLQDPAVVNANAAEARNTELGKVSSAYARSFAGSGG
jgi:hypothetical protein